MDDWSETAVIVAGVIISLGVVLKIAGKKVSFDINAWLKSRDERRKETLKVLCTHTEIDPDLQVSSLFISPFGTTNFICTRCGIVTLDSSMPERLAVFYAQNPTAWIEQEKEFNKLANKIYKT